MKITEILMVAEDVSQLQAMQKKVDFKQDQQAAYARSKWHKAQAQKYKGKDDPESQAAFAAHDEAESDWLMISQEYLHKNPTVAFKQVQRSEAKLEKSKLAAKDVAGYKKINEGVAGERVEYTDYEDWKNALPQKHKLFKEGQIERARTVGEAIDGVIGQFDRNKNFGWIYAVYTK
jgi:DNA replication initiation complex subunit (GINS family)